jgi:hypothetical protein
LIFGARFTFELGDKSRCLAEPFQPLFGGKAMKLRVAIEVFGLALRKRALEFLRWFDFSFAVFHENPAASPIL